MNIRKATSFDIPAIMAIVKNVVPIMQAAGNFQWSDDYPNTEIFEQDVKLNQLWVAEVDNEIAAVAAITTDQYPGYATVGLDTSQEAIVVHRLAVDPKHQGKKIAGALMNEAEQEAIRRDIRFLRIDTNTENKAIQNLFIKLGYNFSGEFDLDFRPGLRFYCYEKTLAL